MKKIFTALCILAVTFFVSQDMYAQPVYDSANFSISKLIRPGDYSQWPDQIAAWRVYANYDLDKDGKKEFLVVVDAATTTSADTSMPRILRFEANGNDTYDLVWSVEIPYVQTVKGSWPCIAVGDMDKDGLQEIFFGLPFNASLGGDPNPNSVYIYEYNADTSNFLSQPTMTTTFGLPAGYYHAITSIVVDDVDADGDVEMITSARRSYGGGSLNSSARPLFIYRLLGDISPGFSSFELEFADTIGTFNGGYYFNNHVIDFDGDGKKEIWGFTWDMIAYAVYEATGKDTYVLQAEVNQATNPLDWGEQNSVSFFDANKDGKLEMFLAAQNGTTGPPDPQSAIFYVANTTNLASLDTASEKQISQGFVDRFFQGAEAGDLDGDGEVEFYVGDWSSERKVYRLRHLNGMPFDDASGYKLDTLYYATNDSNYTLTNVTIGHDLDGDNKMELILVNTDTRIDHPEDVSLIILESKVVVVSVRTISEAAPKSFSLEQNYPNPFNPSSTIRFSLMAGSNVEIYISNSLGQRVATLIDKKMETGSHEVTFNADGLASGTYFYTLKAGSFTETKKMVLMK